MRLFPRKLSADARLVKSFFFISLMNAFNPLLFPSFLSLSFSLGNPMSLVTILCLTPIFNRFIPVIKLQVILYAIPAVGAARRVHRVY